MRRNTPCQKTQELARYSATWEALGRLHQAKQIEAMGSEHKLKRLPVEDVHDTGAIFVDISRRR